MAKTKKVIPLKAKDHTLGTPDFARPALSQSIPYENLPELMRILVDACVKFGINATTDAYPLAKEFRAHFEQLRTSDGREISFDLAEKMATICRPVRGRRGGLRARVNSI